jgi:hypothetical protein
MNYKWETFLAVNIKLLDYGSIVGSARVAWSTVCNDQLVLIGKINSVRYF